MTRPSAARCAITLAAVGVATVLLSTQLGGDTVAGSVSGYARQLACASGASVTDLQFEMSARFSFDGATCEVVADCKAAHGRRLRMDVREVVASSPFFRVWPGDGSRIILNGDRILFHNGVTGTTDILEAQDAPSSAERFVKDGTGGPSDLPRIAGYLRALVQRTSVDNYELVDDVSADGGANARFSVRPPTKVLEPATVDSIRLSFDQERGVPVRREALSDGRVVSRTDYLDHAPVNGGTAIYTRSRTKLADGDVPVVLANNKDRRTESSVSIGEMEVNTTFEWDEGHQVLLPTLREVRTSDGQIVAQLHMRRYRVNQGMPDFWFYIPTEEVDDR